MAKQTVGKNEQSKQRLGMCKGREERSKGFEEQKEIKHGEAISVSWCGQRGHQNPVCKDPGLDLRAGSKLRTVLGNDIGFRFYKGHSGKHLCVCDEKIKIVAVFLS